jgi:hypothetical protein
MRKISYYIIISLFHFLFTQSLLAYAGIPAPSCQSLEFSKNIKPAFLLGTETSTIVLQSWSDDDLNIAELLDDEDETWLTLRKNKSTTLKIFYNSAQYVFIKYYSVAHGKYELPCRHHFSTPYFISFRELRI